MWGSGMWSSIMLSCHAEHVVQVSVRHNEDIISVWNKNAENTEAKNKIRCVREYMSLSEYILSQQNDVCTLCIDVIGSCHIMAETK